MMLDPLAPPTLDDDLQYAVAFYKAIKDLGTPKAARLRHTRAEKIDKATRRLELLLQQDVKDDRHVLRRYPLMAPDPLEVLRSLRDAATKAIEFKLPPDPPSAEKMAEQFRAEAFTRSPFEWLAGFRLAQIYALHFRESATLQRDVKGVISGPYVQFVAEVLWQFRIFDNGEPYSLEAIARALTAARAGRSRRRGR